MNKLLTFLILIISTCFASQAQKGFVKYKINTTYRDSIIVYEGEIVPFISAQSNKINVIIDSVTITNLNSNSNSFEIVSSVDTSYLSKKEDYLQLKKEGLIWLNVTGIPITEHITLISENGDQVIKLNDKRDTILNLNSLGKTCRLIISNSPTIFYSIDKLKQFVEPVIPVQDTTKTTIVITEQSKKGWVWWYYLIISVLVTGLGIIIRIILKKMKKLNSNEVIFNSNSLTDFAQPHGGLDILRNLNPKLIPSKKDWDKLKNKEKDALIKKLKGKRIIIKPAKIDSFGFQEGDNNQSNGEQINESETQQEVTVSSTDLGKNEELLKQLKQIENNLIREIQKTRLVDNNTAELNRLKGEKGILEDKIKIFENENANFKTQIEELQRNEISFEDKLKILTNDNNQFKNENRELKAKVFALDFLKSYAENIISYFKFCQQVSIDAFSFYKRIYQQNPDNSFVTGQLLMNFQSSINTIPIGNWIQTVQDILDTGVTNNRQLIRSFAQCESDSEITKEFQRLLYSEVLIKYSSNLLILLEAFANLSHFNVESGLVNESQLIFGKHVSELVGKAKSTGIVIKHVSLFENFEKHLGDVDSIDSNRSIPYKQISNLEKGAIAEIVSFGIKTNFEDTKTIIILA